MVSEPSDGLESERLKAQQRNEDGAPPASKRYAQRLLRGGLVYRRKTHVRTPSDVIEEASIYVLVTSWLELKCGMNRRVGREQRVCLE